MGRIYEVSCDRCGLMERNTTDDCEHFRSVFDFGEPNLLCDSCQVEYNAFSTGLRQEYQDKIAAWVRENIPVQVAK